MNLSNVSKTAIITLRSHVIEAHRRPPLIHDPMAAVCLERLHALAKDAAVQQIFERKLSRVLTSHIAIRARQYDAIVNTYIAAHPGCTVINLGCGFDTRFWRIDNRNCRYIDLDLPAVIELKQAVLADELEYEVIGASVLDVAWIDQVTATNNRQFVLVAEGLFMYLPRPAVIELFQQVAAKFADSQLVFEVVTEKYTRGLWKKIVEMKFRSEMGVDAGAAYNFGVKRGAEIEDFAPGLKVINEWSFVDDADVYPRILKYMGLARTQWTVTAAIN
ncbi:MAG: class I SAM-dependent methyltransferase [Caldilineaceae bacterium]